MVELDQNCLFFSGDVTSDSAMEFTKALLQFERNNANLSEPQPLKVYIDSYGGAAYCGINMAMEVRRLAKAGYRTEAHNAGTVASAATLPYLACDQRFMHDGLTFLAHQPNTRAWGLADDMAHVAERLAVLHEWQIAFYAKRLSKTEKQVKKMLDWSKDRYYGKPWCREHNIVTED